MRTYTPDSHTYAHEHAEHQLLEKKGKIVFVDLAGSERLRDTGTKGKVFGHQLHSDIQPHSDHGPYVTYHE